MLNSVVRMIWGTSNQSMMCVPTSSLRWEIGIHTFHASNMKLNKPFFSSSISHLLFFRTINWRWRKRFTFLLKSFAIFVYTPSAKIPYRHSHSLPHTDAQRDRERERQRHAWSQQKFWFCHLILSCCVCYVPKIVEFNNKFVHDEDKGAYNGARNVVDMQKKAKR